MSHNYKIIILLKKVWSFDLRIICIVVREIIVVRKGCWMW